MITAVSPWPRGFVVVAALAFLGGCVEEGPVSPDRVASSIASQNESRGVDLDKCPKLAAPSGSTLAWHVFANGVQIYRWSGTAWTLVGPSAVLSADAGGNSVVGTHYVGPTWESNSGSKVVGAVIERCTPNPNAIAWLLLGAVSGGGPGVLHDVTHIQRVNTVGGVSPSAPGQVIGEEVRISYSAEYLFYRAN